MRLGYGLGGVLSASLLLLFVLPIAALFWTAGSAGIFAALANQGFVVSIEFTLLASAIAVAIGLLLGVPLGYFLARFEFRGRSLIESIVLLPVMIPHLVVGLGLLLVFLPGTPLGEAASAVGLPVFDHPAGVVLVMLYVGTSYVVLASQNAFRSLDRGAVEAARSLGATPAEAFWSVSLPHAASGVLTGGLLMWARGVSEVGGFLILAAAVYPGPGWGGPVTSPASVYIYNLYGTGGLAGATAASALLVLVALAIFLAVRALAGAAPRFGPLGGGG